MSGRATDDLTDGTNATGTLAVLGAGCWGTTLATLESDNFRKVQLYTPEADVCEEINRYRTNARYLDAFRVPEGVHSTTRLEQALDGASLVIVVVPSHAVREVARGFSELSSGKVPVVIATKGLEKGTGLLALEIWREEMPTSGRKSAHDAMVLSGPNLAREIGRGLPAISVLAGQDSAELELSRERLAHRLLSLCCNNDPIGVQAAGALKNVYAVGCGMAQGLSWGDNMTGALIWRGLEETSLFVDALGGLFRTIMTPAGVGDFVTTCTSPLSRNHDLGRILAGSGGPAEGVRGVREGAQTAQEALRRARTLDLELPLLEAIWAVMTGAEGPLAIVEAVCSQSPVGAQRDGLAGFRVDQRRFSAPGVTPDMGVATE